MKKTVYTYGLITGGITCLLMAFNTLTMANGAMSFESGEIIGYTSILISLALVYLGVRSYRDQHSNGLITFGKAFKIGVLISLIASVMYVIAWMIIYYNFIPDFMDKYSAHVLDELKESGATQAEFDKKAADMAQFKEWYKNPLIVIAITFLEFFPIGLLIALVAALILKRKRQPAAMA